MLEQLHDLKAQIERDLKVSSNEEDYLYHTKGLDAVEALIDYLS